MAMNLVRGPHCRLHSRLQSARAVSAGVQSGSILHRESLSWSARLKFCAAPWQPPQGFGAAHPRHRSRSLRQRSGICFASWGADIQWSKARVVESSEAAQGLRRLVLDIGENAKGHLKVGQFVQLKVDQSSPGFYAIASPPDPNNQGVIELLIKCQGATSELLCSQIEGAEIETSPVQGKGFQLDKVSPNDFPTVLIFATGSGISPVRSIIESDALQAAQRKDVRLYYGTFNADKTAYKDLFSQWEAAGIKVQSVFSDEGHGYVQDVFQKDGIEDASKTCAILVGQKDMCIAVTDLLVAQGVDKAHILLNF